MVVQKRELLELVGFETRNKYVIESGGTPILYAAEQSDGFLGAVLRHFLGHWRTFEIHIFDTARKPLLRAVHPFRFWMQRLEVYAADDGRMLGAIQQRFSFFRKSFDVLDASDNVILSVSSPFWKPWTFAFERAGAEWALVQKKWSGLLREAFTDADRFRVAYTQSGLGPDERALVLSAALFIDLQYFERKASQ